jgi:hypothetical protein
MKAEGNKRRHGGPTHKRQDNTEIDPRETMKKCGNDSSGSGFYPIAEIYNQNFLF